MMRRSTVGMPIRVLLVALCIAPVAAASARAGDRAAAEHAGAGAAMQRMTMVGNMDPYPNLERAGQSNVRRARRLQRASRATMHRFDTLAKARALGYATRRMRRPGFVHARKLGTRFWGRKFDPTAPQALVFWCPARGTCALTTYMYRAPAGRPPSTWGDLLQWHRHGDRSTTWMTHVWLLPHTRPAFATCAPWSALMDAYDLKQPARYHHDMTDEACRDEGAMPMADQ
jgi:hypothetical protein